MAIIASPTTPAAGTAPAAPRPRPPRRAQGRPDHHRPPPLPDPPRGGYRTDVAALDHRFHRFPGVEIDGPERLPEGRDRLHCGGGPPPPGRWGGPPRARPRGGG